MSYFLITSENSTVSLEELCARVTEGVQKLLGQDHVNVCIKNEGVFWTLCREAIFIVRVADADLIKREAKDLASFNNDNDQSSQILQSQVRFTCHNQDRTGEYLKEFNYLMDILRCDYESWCFCLDSRQYVSTSYNKKALFAKERNFIGLSAQTISKRSIVTRIFNTPLPTGASSEQEFLDTLSIIPLEFIDHASSVLNSRSYDEIHRDSNRCEFVFTRNKGWGLRVNVTSGEICFSLPPTKYYTESALSEAFQASMEIVSGNTLKIYDAKNDRWLGKI